MILNKPGSGTICLFYRQLAAMLASGVPLPEAIATLEEDNENRFVKKMVAGINQDTKQGIPIIKCLAKHPRFFSNDLILVITREDRGEALSKIFSTMADEIEKSAELKARMLKIAFLPGVSLVVAFCLMFVLFVFVLPVFSRVFESFGESLPAPTLLVFAMSEFYIENFFYLLVLVGAVFLFFVLPATKKLRYGFISRIPLLGKVLKKIAMAKFLRYLSMMLSFNTPLNDALKYSAIHNTLYKDQIKTLGKEVKDPKQLRLKMQETKIFPKMVLQMIRVGEKSGSYTDVLSQLSDYYQKEIDISLDKLIYFFDVFLLLLVGFVVGTIVISMYLPIFQMAGAI